MRGPIPLRHSPAEPALVKTGAGTHPSFLLPLPLSSRMRGPIPLRHSPAEPALVKTGAGTHPSFLLPLPLSSRMRGPIPLRHSPAEPALVKTGAGTHPSFLLPTCHPAQPPHVAFQTECCALAPVIPVGAVREPPVPEEYRCPTPNVSLPRTDHFDTIPTRICNTLMHPLKILFLALPAARRPYRNRLRRRKRPHAFPYSRANFHRNADA